MKGLLLKEWYMLKTYCRSYLFISALFVAISLFSSSNLFLVFYPCLLCGMIPVNLLAYDERSRWLQYSASLPCTKAQIVSAKYLISLFAQAAMLIITLVAQSISMSIRGTFLLHDLVMLMLLFVIMASLTSSIPLPFMFRLGVEKGRIAYYVMIGFACAASVMAANVVKAPLPDAPNALLALLALGGIGVYALSWYLSIRFYQKREIN